MEGAFKGTEMQFCPFIAPGAFPISVKPRTPVIDNYCTAAVRLLKRRNATSDMRAATCCREQYCGGV